MHQRSVIAGQYVSLAGPARLCLCILISWLTRKMIIMQGEPSLMASGVV